MKYEDCGLNLKLYFCNILEQIRNAIWRHQRRRHILQKIQKNSKH